MRNAGTSRMRAPWTVTSRLAVSLLLMLAGGCGGGARPDVQLNEGQITSDPADESAVRALFPMLGDPRAEPAGGESDVYRVQTGDQLEVTFFTHPEQNRFVTVRPDGRISMPFVGEMVADGKTPGELSTEIQTAYAEVLVSPRVDVIVQQAAGRFYVLGEVRSPGEFQLDRPVTLVQALAQAGGYSPTARLTHIVLMRKDERGKTYAGVFDFRNFVAGESRFANIEVKPYDIVWVPRSALARWDNATEQTFRGVMDATRIAIDGWTLANFEDVYINRFR